VRSDLHRERLGGIVAATPVTIAVWMTSWWNNRGHVGSERGSHTPVHYAWSCPSHRRDWVSQLGLLWLLALLEGSTRPSGEAEVR
jgi:hypothetical protein